MWQDERYTKAEDRALHDYSSSIGRSYRKVQDWNGAMNYCKKLTLAGYSDWELPNKMTLRKLEKNIDKLKNKASTRYWSSSEPIFSFSNAWLVDLYDGRSYSYDKTRVFYVRCVRGRQ